MTRFSSVSSPVAYFNVFGLFEKLCRLNPFMACFVFPLHCWTLINALTTRGSELHKSYFGRDASFKGELCLHCFWKGELCFRGSLSFVFALCLIDHILSHDWCWALSAFSLGIMWFLVSVALSCCPYLRGQRFCFFRIVSAFSLGFWIFWEKFCSFSV